MVKRCALLNCECDDSTPTLKELSENWKDDSIRNQANLLISKFGFTSSDIICDDCFWK